MTYPSGYNIKTSKVENKPGTWNSLLVEVFKNDAKIGEYTRQYPSILNTFLPFKQDNKDYALISSDYMRTSVMDLETGLEIATEVRNGYDHFCPADFWHPNAESTDDDFWPPEDYDGTWALVGGCIWGDDTSWKLQHLDLSRINEGLVLRDDRYGYVELGGRMSGIDWWPNESDTLGDYLSIPVKASMYTKRDKKFQIYGDCEVEK